MSEKNGFMARHDSQLTDLRSLLRIPRIVENASIEGIIISTISEMEYLCESNDRMVKRVNELEAENERLKDLFVRLRNWQQAYPLKAFPMPEKVKERFE